MSSIESGDRRREAFPTLSDGVYLLSHSLGPAPASVREAALGYVDVWTSHARSDAWREEWLGLSGRFGAAVARLIGAGEGTVTPTPSATLATAIVASCHDFSGRRRKVVTSELDFPSMGYLWRAHAALGAEVVVVPAEDGVWVDPERVAAEVDEGTALVALSHTSYRSSGRLDPEPIVERAHRVGARVCLDAYQSVGVVELEARAWGVDFMVGGTIKWLCGGPACGWLYVREDLQDTLEPRLTGWLAHEEPFAFAGGAIRYARGIARFANGTPGIPALYSALPGLEIVESVGVRRIARESRARTQSMIESALEAGVEIGSPVDASRRGGTVVLACPDPAGVTRELARRGVFVDWRPEAGLRVSPHFFNTDEEVSLALSLILELARQAR